MSVRRTPMIVKILKGWLLAVVLTLILMLATALVTLFARLSDSTLLLVNQVIKILSILVGVRISVGRGGQRGFVTGMVIALLYMISGYLMYVFLGGEAFDTVQMLGEILLGAAIGGILGAVLANMSPKGSRKKRTVHA